MKVDYSGMAENLKSDLKKAINKTNETLKPCPFCGGKAFIRQNKDAMKTYSVYCGNEDCSASPKVSAYGKEMAIGLWNTRKPAEEVVARLEEKMRECRKMKEVVYDLGMHQGLRDVIEIVKEGMG